MDESFVMENIADELRDEDREILNLFIEQSQQMQEDTEEDVKRNSGVVKGAYYRICDVPPKQCNDSPLEAIEHPERITSKKRTVFGHKGQMIHTDGTGRRTKLTKVYKRDDNRGALFKALRRMKLNI